MGNLPNSRTVNANPSDSVSSALADEMQDCVIGAKRKLFWRTFYPRFITFSTFAPGGSGVTLGGINHPGYTCSAAAANAAFDIPFDDGDRLMGFRYWAGGNGTVDLTNGFISYSGSPTVADTTLALWADVNRAAAWGSVDVTAIASGPAFTPQILVIGGALTVSISTNAAGYVIGPCTAAFDRL